MKLLLSITTTLLLLLVTTLACAQDAAPVQVPFDAAALATMIGSGWFAVAATALLRKAWPKIDGILVYVVTGVLMVVSQVLARHAGQVPLLVVEIVGPIVTLIGAVGTVQLAQSIASKSGAANSSAPKSSTYSVNIDTGEATASIERLRSIVEDATAAMVTRTGDPVDVGSQQIIPPAPPTPTITERG